MNRSTKIGLGIGGFIVLLILAIVIAGFVVVRRPFPDTSGTISLAGLQEPVEIYRDEFGIPHIYAQNEHDLFFAQGYTHAQDRFWQMEFWRHISAGRISEIAGESTVESDMFIRTMGWNRIAEETLAYYEENEPELMAIMEAYAKGVNAYIDENQNNISMNYTVLGLVNDQWEIEPWTPLHTVGWSIVMSDDLSGNWSDEVRRANLIKELGESTVANLQPFYPYESRPVIAPTDQLTIDGEEAAILQEAILNTAVNWENVSTNLIGSKPDLGYLGAEGFVGSNNWVIHGDHTPTGMPLLANDPHLGIQMPSIWYEIGLHAPGYDVTGFSFAGTPGVIIGHNENIAWGVTNVRPDIQDVYIEKINPSNPNQYEFEGEWLDMEIIEEVIRVNGGEDVVLNVRLTHHGPIISEVLDDATDMLSMRWTAHEPNKLLAAIVGLNRAGNYDDFRDALRNWDVPSQNVVYADIEGNIAYQMPGLVPIRKDGNGLVPVPGWTGEYEWEGWIEYDELPALFNPDQGYIVTANHAVIDEEFPHLINLYWADGNRGQRITDMIEAELNGDGTVS
ncbi:MAG: penicillin acylase family protein, partial [Chloroflexota bacterium]